MPLIKKFKELNVADWSLVARAFMVVVSVRIALWTLPFKVTQVWVDRFRATTGPVRELDRHTINRTAWAVIAVSRRVPGATCLTQGMATQILLGRLGQESKLHLGVSRKNNGKFEAHAWVETQGRVINGGGVEGFDRFTRLEKHSS